MSFMKLLLAEIRFRKLHFFLSLLAVTMAVSLLVASPVLIDGYTGQTEILLAEQKAKTTDELAVLKDKTRLLMRDIGFNLMIVHRDTNMSDFWASDFASKDMPQEYIDRLASARSLRMVTHLVATLQSRFEWDGRKVLLVGYLPEATQSHLRKKTPMGYQIPKGTVFLGHELGVGREVGQTIDVDGKKFTIGQILPEQGSKEDIMLAMHLSDAQAVLDKPGRINQILALGCRCAGSSLPNIRKQLATVLPEARITEFRSIALARAEQRDLVKEKQQKILDQLTASREAVQDTLTLLATVLIPIVVVAAVVWVGLLALVNVRQRRGEIGLLRALGKRSWLIGSLFLGKAILLGLIGGLVGLIAGSLLGQSLGTRLLGVSPELFHVDPTVIVVAILGAPIVSALASYLPTLIGVLQDPATVLRDF
jgi:putative ABC transport system permease protein